MSDGGVVGGAAVPHAPQFFTLPDTEDHEQVARIRAVMGELGDRLRSSAPDAVVIIANDHVENFALHCVPSFTVHRGPWVAGSFAGRDFSWTVASDVSTRLVQALQGQGFDPAVSLNAPIGYEFGIPLTFLGFPADTPLVPIYVNSYVPPQPSGDRCYAFGQALAQAAERLGHRLCVIASGGLSHYPGTDQYAHPDLGTDRVLLDRMGSGNLRSLLSFSDAELDRTGNVEARSWLMLAGALGEHVPELVRMEPSWHHNYAIVGWPGPPAGTRPARSAAAPAEGAGEEPVGGLHYPVPRADQLALYEALYALRMHESACREFLTDPAAFADAYALDPDERAALLAVDEQALRELGVHPLLGFLARLHLDLIKKTAAAPAAAPAGQTPAVTVEGEPADA